MRPGEIVILVVAVWLLFGAAHGSHTITQHMEAPDRCVVTAQRCP